MIIMTETTIDFISSSECNNQSNNNKAINVTIKINIFISKY